MKDLLESLKLGALFGRHSANSSSLIHPRRDWKVLALFLALGFLAGSGFAAQTYARVASGTLVEAPALSAKTGETLDIEALARLNELLAERERALADILSQRAPVSDPR